MLSRSVVLLLATSTFVAAQFSCPLNTISKNNGMSGSIPPGAASMVQVPAGSTCTFKFDIPKGFALKIETTADYDISKRDSIKFDDFYITSPAEKKIEYAVRKTLPYNVVSKSGSLKFFATYTYVDISNYQQVIKATGTFFNTTLEANKFTTVRAANNDQVALKYGSRETGFHDETMYQTFVFDGNDFMNSEYLGRYTDLYHGPDYTAFSTSNTLTLLNLYRTPSDSLFISNDASAVKKYDQYKILVVSSANQISGLMYNFHDNADAWYTIICDGCNSINIKSLDFDTSYNGYLEVQELSPTQKLPPKFRFQAGNNQLPQLVSAPMTTFHTYKARVSFTVQGEN
ncbi:CUB-like domain-containing protein [Caenorhabditis elegans]|uniref:CUB-like domain-containing protein n=1 Tax=Caenorhabditis elegans TaxID=6239 RepID=O02357_CAEEL|nr:CUB-like domain-containing protein [Caenorhabditis elegans]CAB04272.2 CUB-like domain-containing protein [Caenorhabditis elegans]|eukprot:NP_506402.2 Infection Response Gene [Caenorhabditis elegans]